MSRYCSLIRKKPLKKWKKYHLIYESLTNFTKIRG
jgi:hypothetical protein